MSTARSTVGSLFGAVEAGATTVGTLFGTANTAVGMLDSFVQDAAEAQNKRRIINQASLNDRLAEEAQIEASQRADKINAYLADKSTSEVEQFNAGVARFKSLLEPK